MKKNLLLFILVTALLCNQSNASITPGDSSAVKTTNGGTSFNKLLTLSPVEIQKFTGRKLTLVEKIKLKLVQYKLHKQLAGEKGEPTEKQRKQGELSMILGISSLVLLILPVIGLLALPAAITALILGINSTKGNSNTKGIVGIITGSVTIFLFILVIAFIAAFLSGGRI